VCSYVRSPSTLIRNSVHPTPYLQRIMPVLLCFQPLQFSNLIGLLDSQKKSAAISLRKNQEGESRGARSVIDNTLTAQHVSCAR
jgi:hypothetical protein